MKRHLLSLITGLLLVCFNAQGSAIMQYRIVPVSNSQWMSAKEKDINEVREQIDRIAQDGYNVISIGTYYCMPLWFVDYSSSPWPEAAHFTADKVRQNTDTMRAHIRYAKKKGIRYVVSRSYSHYAPYNFWMAHQAELNPGGVFSSLMERAHQSDMYFNALKGKGVTVPQQQWTNPVFRDFFLWSTEKMLDLLPELDGFLNAYAEAAWTYDVSKLPGEWKSWKECVDYPATDSCFVDYSNRLYAMLEQKRGQDFFFGLRDWYVSPEVLAKLKMPRERLVIAVKYAGYDQPLINYPPWAKELLDAGFGVALDMHVYDAEYPHPVYWYSSEIVGKIFDNMYKGGFTGFVYQDYTLRGEDTHDNPIRVLTQKTVSAAAQQKPFSDKDAAAFLKPYYGAGTADVLRSLGAVAEAQQAWIKLMPAWFWRGDGLSVGGLQPPRLWMMADNPEAGGRMDFVRQDVIGMKEYVNAFLEGGEAFVRVQKQWKQDGKLTPEDVIALMEQCGDEAVTAALAARKAAPAGAPYMRDIVASAFIHRELAARNAAYARAAMALYKSGYVWDDRYVTDKECVRQTGLDLRDECRAQMERYVAADLMMRRLMLDYAPRRRKMRHENTYENEKKIVAVAGRKLTMPTLDEARFAQIAIQIENK